MVRTQPNKTIDALTVTLNLALSSHATLAAPYEELLAQGWKIFVTSQTRGWVRPQARWITIPEWAITKGLGPNYWVYYAAHEMAHAYGFHNHGPQFMDKFKELCPPELWCYELGYKPREAKAAGISHNASIKDVEHTAVKDLWDIL